MKKTIPESKILLGITIRLVNDLSKLTHVPQIPHRHELKQFVKRIYLPLRGVPDGPICAGIAGNHLSALLPQGNTKGVAFSECPILDGVLLDEPLSDGVIENLNQCLSIEMGVFIDGREMKPKAKIKS